MPRYTVKHAYAASRDGLQFGPWEKGSEVELDQADAEWVERDSPGALVEVQPKPAKPARTQAPAQDRQQRGGPNRGA